MRVLICILALTALAACAEQRPRQLVSATTVTTPTFGYSYDLEDQQLASAYAAQTCGRMGMRAYHAGTQAFVGDDDRVSFFNCR